MNRVVRVVLILLSIFIIAGCGQASQEDVKKELEEVVGDLTSYQTKAKMEMLTGETAQLYEIDLAYQSDHFYRVLMHNEGDEEGSQIILKNDDGVFVLTPALNKSFRFQSDWPSNASQPYLYHSLVADVLNDDQAEFKVTDQYYVFKTQTNYQHNKTLPIQEVYFDQDSLTPYLVKIYDADHNVAVEVTFEPFELGVEFEPNFFEVDANLTSGIFSLPVGLIEGEHSQSEFIVRYPTALMGAELSETAEFDREEGKRVVLTYQGEKEFTIVQDYNETAMVAVREPELSAGVPVHIGKTIGAMTDQSLTWSENGVDYYLASEQLTREEMIEVAQSMGQQMEK
ncbi:Outer membrane lipoprotein-sorting protein [Amphibacillus marinus]|uniref:Outer membrane lipoprotein-sorting protein n=1 Tax=Amphibacillus marinus TaxID=872970 RepID=A0A1H8JPA9_9BACI|nr:outer membrane lipoprotein carrier protein LolA [Amphibacillus marinus]SEN82395.1 Outer membrane lipoprotein-sorting protein [Amphibacillus marinus]